MTGATIETVEAIDCRLAPGGWRFAQDRAEAIDAHWRGVVEGNPHLFNGRILLMRAAEIRHGGDGARTFGGAFVEVEYKAFLYWRHVGFPDADMVNVFAMAALQAGDGAFILGEMGAHTANPGQIYFPAGTPDRDDVFGDRVDLDGSARRELFEETGLSESDVTAAPGWTIVRHGPRIACMKLLRASEPADDLVRRIHAAHAAERARGDMPELARMHVYRRQGDAPAARMPDFMRAYLERFQPG